MVKEKEMARVLGSGLYIYHQYKDIPQDIQSQRDTGSESHHKMVVAVVVLRVVRECIHRLVLHRMLLWV